MRWLLAFTLLTACGDDDARYDDGGLVCASNSDCDDGLYCNGAERCDPDVPGSDVLGCVEGPRPCAEDVCSESDDVCFLTCTTDDDGDGVRAMACGGTDCDDHDARRYPGRPEACDVRGHDEDCDPTTFGRVDADGDGWLSSACCNGEHCGEDCDDASASVHPMQPEACNGADDDCDFVVDEGCDVPVVAPIGR